MYEQFWYLNSIEITSSAIPREILLLETIELLEYANANRIFCLFSLACHVT